MSGLPSSKTFLSNFRLIILVGHFSYVEQLANGQILKFESGIACERAWGHFECTQPTYNLHRPYRCRAAVKIQLRCTSHQHRSQHATRIRINTNKSKQKEDPYIPGGIGVHSDFYHPMRQSCTWENMTTICRTNKQIDETWYIRMVGDNGRVIRGPCRRHEQQQQW